MEGAGRVGCREGRVEAGISDGVRQAGGMDSGRGGGMEGRGAWSGGRQGGE